MKKKILLSPPHMSGEEIEYIKEAFASNWIAPLGPNVEAFEKELASYVGANDAIAVSSGTAAIHLALSLLDVKKDDIVFCSTLTFVASANPILYLGAEPVFIDSEPDTWNMSPLALERALKDAASDGKLPKAVIVVNLYGQPAKMDEICELCKLYNVPIIEDAAESLGSTYKGQASGTFGKFGVYSFNGNKIITTSGGGMLVSNDSEAIKNARFLAAQAKDPAPYYQHSKLGYNYRMSNILAAVGRSQLKVLHQRVETRRNIFNSYYSFLAELQGINFMPELEHTQSNRWLTALTISENISPMTVSALLEVLEAANIEARHVWKPLHMQPLFKDSTYYPHDENEHVAEKLFKTGLCLPSGSNLTTAEQLLIISTITKAFKYDTNFVTK
ncbi:aminotransferase class I/II-fold pyridoxal phosphate-dependent enzyme [Bacillus sp. AGMB 02131]|uniref:Aminotransferase class I/II-fold pyridoxal phosphate-dependent enzyme n=1 Tax=Peribacillus faecalis TaxID=2772559 RepID=A0A927CTR6_9BACI|nr:aminotransferase class I/II-fold pyridoxal phosphate-dependent enzyme [Peribacillus faecalis]MBD3107687.1 aminotransferase class I/II-fold pyridoxal phosphate-dependent enzyme [Peribacillus faecalis]